MPVQTQNVSGIFATNAPVIFAQHFEHIAVTHLCPLKGNTAFGERCFQAVIGHLGADHATTELAQTFAMRGDDVDQLVAVIESTTGVGHDQSISVAVECNADVGFVLDHHFRDVLGMRCAHALVDIGAVRRHADADHFRAQFVKHGGGDLVGRAVRAVDHNFEPAQAELRWKRPLAKFDIATGRVVQPLGLAQLV